MKKLLLILVSCSLYSFNAHSFGTFMGSSNVLKKGEYDLTATTQSFSNGESGSNFLLMGELPFRKNMNLRLTASTGAIGFNAGAHLKWLINGESFKRPNFGVLFSTEFASEDSDDYFMLRAGPFVSKNFSWEHGTMEPYLGIPTGVILIDSDDDFTSQLVVGTRIKFESLNYMSFAVEGGFEIKNSFSHLALFATLQLGK